MKKLFSTQHSSKTDLGLLVARVVIAVLMLTHGIPKMGMLLSGGPVQFPPVMGLSPETSLALAVFAEVVCSVLLLLGLSTRFATLPLIVTMLVAVLSIHAADPLTTKEPALLYLTSYVVLLFTGAGRLSLDQLLQKKALLSLRQQTTGKTAAIPA